MLDRRSLLIAGASSLAGIMLPRVPGSANAFILPFAPTEAYADEEDPFKVLVLSRTMFGVVVVDVANKNTPITGAQVTLTSRYAAGKQLTATTDDEGTAIFEVAPLSEGYVDEATLLDAYDFNGGISISMKGYRDVEIPLARIQGGTAITAPTRPLSDGEPYFRQLTFNEWDIQYADATFMALPKDDTANEQPDTHAFTVQAHLPQGGQATLRINKVTPAAGSSPETVTQIGQVKASASSVDNLAMFTLEDTFLDAASGLLEEGCKLRFVLDYQGKTYTLSSPMTVVTAPAAKAESGSTTIVPTTMDQEVTPFDFPAALPGIGGNKFTCWMPSFPILFDFSFAGYVLFGGGYKPVGYMNDSGNPDPEYWKKSPRESGAKQANRYLDEMKGKWNQYKSMSAGSGTDPRNTKLLRHHCTPLFTMDIATQLYGSLAYDWVGKTWGNNNDPAYGNIKALFQVRTDLNWTEQFTLGPVPFFLNVNPWVLAKLALAVGAHTHGSGAAFFKNISLDYSNTSGSFTIQIGLAVTFGAGVAGVASSAVRGAASLTLFIGYEKADGHQLPRLRVGADVDVDVILQFVMFKWTTKAWSGSWPTLLDSWNMSVNNGNQYVLQRSELALGGDTPYTLDARFGTPGNIKAGGVPQFIASATIVTNAELLARAEVKATARNVAPVVRDWDQAVARIELEANAESDDTGQIEHFVHALMENDENAAPMYAYTHMGVRTESWTAGRSGLEVRMYSREKVELFLLATEDGMGPTAAAEFAGVTVSAAKKWATGHLPRSYTGGGCRIVARKPPRKEASLGPDKSIYAPPATGPLAGLNEDQIENLLLRAVLADLKAEEWDPASISNRSKCELGERLRLATALPLRSITGFLRISKSSYEYWRPRVAAPRDRDADIRDRVVRIFREGSGCWGYRTVWARLRREGVRASEKRVARVMLLASIYFSPVSLSRRARGYSSYAGEVSKAPENLVNRNFHADEPNRLWLTDITEFRLPGGEKVYLSPIVDCFDGMPVAWSIGLHPDKSLANSSLLKACAARPAGARTTIHSDRGGHYRWPEWIGICEENGLVRSMSAKGCSPDNSACEGFFGRLKNEFFRYRDWEGVTAEEFMGRLEAYLVYYRDGRIKKSLEWLSPMEYRRKLGYA